MTTTQKVLLLGGGALLVSTLLKAKSAGNLNFYPQGVDGIQVKGGVPVLTAKILVQNVGGAPLVLRSIAGNAYANNMLIGNGQNFQGVLVPGNGQVIVPIYIQMSIGGIVQDIINAFNNGIVKQTIEWDAAIAIDGLPVQNQKIKFVVG